MEYQIITNLQSLSFTEPPKLSSSLSHSYVNGIIWNLQNLTTIYTVRGNNDHKGFFFMI